MKLKKLVPWTTLLIFSIFTIIIFTADIPNDDQVAKFLTTTTESQSDN